MNKLVRSHFFVPVIFFLLNWKVWLGTRGFVHDTGDQIGAFKFASFIPKYWNWFESGGQPYWYDLARLHDPFSWLAMVILKALPIDTYAAYGIFVLLRIMALGVGISLLVNSLGFSWRVRQLATFLALFASLAASIYIQSGMLDIAFPFVMILYCLIRLAQTDRGVYLAGIGLVILHCSLAYSLVMLPPVFLMLGIATAILYPSSMLALGRALKKRVLGIATIGFGTAILSFSTLTATNEAGFLPMTRNVHYNSPVDINGTNLSRDEYGRRNIYDTSPLAAASNHCFKTMRCTEYYADYLVSFLRPDTSGNPITAEFVGFIGRAALLISLLGLFLGRRKLAWIFASALVTSLFLSFGTQYAAWPLAQRVFPFLEYARHTHFYLSLVVVSLLGLFCVGFEAIEKRRADLARLAAMIVIAEGFWFHFAKAVPVQEPVDPELRDLVAQPLPDKIVTRAARFLNPFTLPQTSVATSYGHPNALEPVYFKLDRPPRAGDLDTYDIRYLGYVLPFMLKHTMRARLLLSEDPVAFKRAFGVAPFSILSLHPWQTVRYREPDGEITLPDIASGVNLVAKGLASVAPKEVSPGATASYGIPLTIDGENLTAVVSSPNPAMAYLALPFPHIAEVRIDGVKTDIFKANVFGIALAFPAGKHTLTIEPDLLTARKVFFFFYAGAFLMLGYFVVECGRRSTFPVKELRRSRELVPA